ncbi:DNA recombination protein RmuC [Trichlorobacter ammonificans]|uniref:DNA recombination protein RmuC homolog n=1 Tax=Trichlorobacter ammonificans TaxID=2916410 RepID=A0ABM9D8W4_9BACT|nr:DNA recombination protein RmuC [Trichlorobacter ammonificans]CAH2030812.1 DNA recombination protein RmuC homolog [Trichlorobacter ammonificans]
MPDLLIPALLLMLLVLVVVLLLRVSRLGAAHTPLEGRIDALERLLERSERTLREEQARSREEGQSLARQGREESLNAVKGLGDSLLARLGESATVQNSQLELFSGQLAQLSATTEERLERLRSTMEERLRLLQEESSKRQEQVRTTVDERLRLLQEDNAKKLEQMRATVDEKLHDTLEKRLGESFKLVSDRLEQVQKGLGEMQSLANGVGDLKRVLTNVKTRGTFGEVQLAVLLEQILAPGQYGVNVETRKGSNQRVEFAVRMPGRDGSEESVVHLPLDAKFPQEDYLRLVEAQERADATAAEEAGKLLERAIRLAATDIRDKYLDPPHTTDFGVMYLPTEGLYAEVLRRPGLFEALQREYKVMPAGPTILAALLNSLQLGFRTLAIEKRSAEVWNLLGAVRTEFGKFSDILDKTRKKLQEAGNHIEAAATRTRQMERKLKTVQALPADEARGVLELGDEGDEP